MEWREPVRVKPAAGSALKKRLLFPRRHSDSVEQATFVLYLHSCRIGWDKITEPILVCREVDEEVGQDATETSAMLSPRNTQRVDFPKTAERSANNKRLEWKVYLASSGRSKPAGRKTEAGSGAELYTYCLRPCGFFFVGHFTVRNRSPKLFQQFWSQGPTLKPSCSTDCGREHL